MNALKTWIGIARPRLTLNESKVVAVASVVLCDNRWLRQRVPDAEKAACHF